MLFISSRPQCVKPSWFWHRNIPEALGQSRGYGIQTALPQTEVTYNSHAESFLGSLPLSFDCILIEMSTAVALRYSHSFVTLNTSRQQSCILGSITVKNMGQQMSGPGSSVG